MLTTAQTAAACMMRSASKMGILLLWILAAALVAYSLTLVFLSNFNMGNLMVWVLTAAITACAIWHKPLAGWLHTGAGRVVGIVLSVLLVVYLALIGFVAVSGYANPPTGQEQVMIVLGAGLRKALEGVLDAPLRIDALTLFKQENRNRPFSAVARLPFANVQTAQETA